MNSMVSMKRKKYRKNEFYKRCTVIKGYELREVLLELVGPKTRGTEN